MLVVAHSGTAHDSGAEHDVGRPETDGDENECEKWIFARRGEPEQDAEAGGSEEAVADQKPAYPDTVEQRRADNTTQDATDTLRDGDETGRQRRIVQHVLAVHADDENLGRQPRPDESGHDVTTDERAVVEEARRHQWIPAALLVAHEGDQTHDAPDQTSDEGSGEPAVSCADRRGEDQQGGRRRHHQRAEQIEAPAAFSCPHRGQDAPSDCRDGEADRDVDEEHAAPSDRVDQHAAGNEPDDETDRRRDAVEAEHTVAGGTLPEAGRQNGQARRGDQCRRDALHRPGCDQQRHVTGETACCRCDGETDEPDGQSSAPPEEVGSPPAEHQEPTERQGVGGHNPLRGVRRYAQLRAQRRQRDVHDGEVQYHHKL